jgi:hypothetical protein
MEGHLPDTEASSHDTAQDIGRTFEWLSRNWDCSDPSLDHAVKVDEEMSRFVVFVYKSSLNIKDQGLYDANQRTKFVVASRMTSLSQPLNGMVKDRGSIGSTRGSKGEDDFFPGLEKSFPFLEKVAH